MSTILDTPDAEISGHLREAAAWRMIGVLFECPREGWLSELLALAEESTDAELQEAARAAQHEASEGLYHSTFGPGGPAAPRAVSYRDSLLAGHILGQLRTLHEAFAYRPRIQEPSDHIAVLADFLSYLHFKVAYAAIAGAVEQTAVAADVAARFSADHLSAIGEPLARSLSASGIQYLELAGRALARRVGPPQAPAELTLLPSMDSD